MKKRTWSVFLFLPSWGVALFVASVPSLAAGAEERSLLRAGAASAEVTPDPRLRNWVVPQPYGSVGDPIFVRAAVLSDGPTKVAFLVWDLVDAREFAVQRVRTAVARATGIPEDHIVVQATHNHSGPKSELGPGPDLTSEQRNTRRSQEDVYYAPWADRLVETCVEIVRKADAGSQPATLSIGRAFAGEWIFNRRPVKPSGEVLTTMVPADPYVLDQGLRFGSVDPTLSVLSLRATAGTPIALLFHVPIHAVSVYSSFKGISADWPGAVISRLQRATGAEALFLQGCAGNLVPARRGSEAVETMAELLAERAVAAQRAAVALAPGPLRVSRAVIGIPATAVARAERGKPYIEAEVQVISTGPLALVMLPGEPLLELALAIQQHSPFPHTLVLGYANGRGVGYVGLPGEKGKGGYEMGVVGHGEDEAGGFLVATASRLLQEHAGPKDAVAVK